MLSSRRGGGKERGGCRLREREGMGMERGEGDGVERGGAGRQGE